MLHQPIFILFLFAIVAISNAEDNVMGDEENDNDNIITNNDDNDNAISIIEDLKGKNYEDIFKLTKEAYLANDWKGCLSYGHAALADYKNYHQVITDCKRGCREEAEGDMRNPNMALPGRADVDDLLFYEKLTRATLCLMRCKEKKLGTGRVEMVTRKTEEDFDNKAVYNYLQLCYHQVGDYPAAASAAFTNLVYNGKDTVMAENLAIYQKKPGVVKEFIVNHEAEAYVAPFLTGTEHYRQEEWSDVVGFMEEAIDKYIHAEDSCRIRCEKPFDMGWFPDFVTSVANHFTYCLRCKQRCVTDQQNVNGEEITDIYPLMYNYLQFAYYKLGDLKKASHCVASFLLFYPNDSRMLKNKDYYTEDDAVEAAWLEEPRDEARLYFARDEYERQLIDFIDLPLFGEDGETPGSKVDGANASDVGADGARGDDEVLAPNPPPVVKLEL